MRRLGAVLLAVVGVLLAGCGVRLDTPPPQVPAPDAAEQVRQDAARAAGDLHALARSARTAAGDDAALTEVLITVESAAAEHHAALGGVWEPWPGAGPEATDHPGPDAVPAAPPTAEDAGPQDVLALLEDSAAAAHAGALTHAGDLGRLLASVAISRSVHAEDLAGVLGGRAQTLPAEALPVPEPGAIDPETSRDVDAARYAFEVIAARSSGDERAAALERSGQLEQVAGAVDPEQDQREIAYDITGSGQEPPSNGSLAAAAELDVLRAYVALLAGEGEDRQAVLAAAAHAGEQARSWDGALPALPGLS